MAEPYNWQNFFSDTTCYYNQTFSDDTSMNDYSACNITNGMVSFLNITDTISFINAYCLAPPSDDDCPFGYCPQSDVAGRLTRFGAYLTNFFLSLHIFYKPEKIEDAFQAQLLTIYSLLFATSLTLYQNQLTKFHSVIASILIGSPVTLYLWVYSFWALGGSKTHRLRNTLGPGDGEPGRSRWRPRHMVALFIVLLSLVLWLAMVIFIYSSNPRHFSQPTCTRTVWDILVSLFYAAAGALIIAAIEISPGVGFILILPLLGTILAWIVAIFRQRKEIWKSGFSWKFWRVWGPVNRQYPFIHFMTVIVLPLLYWIFCVELGLMGTHDNDTWNVNFGQILAIIIVVQPALTSITLLKGVGTWLKELTWVQIVCCCRCRKRNRIQRLGKQKASETTLVDGYEEVKLEP